MKTLEEIKAEILSIKKELKAIAKKGVSPYQAVTTRRAKRFIDLVFRLYVLQLQARSMIIPEGLKKGGHVIVGEKGRELIVPKSGNRVFTAPEIQGMKPSGIVFDDQIPKLTQEKIRKVFNEKFRK